MYQVSNAFYFFTYLIELQLFEQFQFLIVVLTFVVWLNYWPFKFTVADIMRHLCSSLTTCTGLMSRKHSSDCDLVPVRGSYHGPDCTPSATGYLELQLRACGTVCRLLSLQPAHSRLSKDNWKPFFSVTRFFSFILIMYHVLEEFSLNAMFIFTFNNNYCVIVDIIAHWREGWLSAFVVTIVTDPVSQ